MGLLNGILYDKNNEFTPLTNSHGNVDENLSNLRNIYMTAEKDYFEKLMSNNNIRERFIQFLNDDSDKLFQATLEIQTALETGKLETSKQIEQMKNLSPEQREKLHMENLEIAEGLMCLLFAAARDKVDILEYVKTYSNGESHSKSR